MADLPAGRLSWRRLGVLVRQLPPGARFHDGTAAEWTVAEHMLATISSHLAGANWQRGGGKGRRPTPVRRPGSDTRTRYGKTTRSPREVATFLAKFAPPPKGGIDGS